MLDPSLDMPFLGFTQIDLPQTKDNASNPRFLS